MNIKTDDKIRVKYGDSDLIFVNLEEALNDFTEDNLNKIVKNVLAIIEKKEMKTEEYHEIWKLQTQLLKQDYSFSVQEGHIIFLLGNAAFHRKNEPLVKLLNKYIEYVINQNKNNNTEFKVPKLKKNKDLKILEGKSGIKEADIDTMMSIEHNLTNLLTVIGNNRQKNSIKI
jgi:hypothetical protein|tara:strand:- start:1820 stop:2335 length:516 start_codon:yes stop_codon:yes gene_type:complete